MNSQSYRIGFFAGILLLSLLYIFSDTRFQAEQESVRAESEMRYYLKEENGTVSVYSGETQELFEKTFPLRKSEKELGDPAQQHQQRQRLPNLALRRHILLAQSNNHRKIDDARPYSKADGTEEPPQHVMADLPPR